MIQEHDSDLRTSEIFGDSACRVVRGKRAIPKATTAPVAAGVNG